jgi:hypothetical protein
METILNPPNGVFRRRWILTIADHAVVTIPILLLPCCLPLGQLDVNICSSTNSERPSLALVPCSPQLPPMPSSHCRSVCTLLARKHTETRPTITPSRAIYEEYPIAKKHIGWAEREILAQIVYKLFFQKPSVPRLHGNYRSRGSQLPDSPPIAPNRAGHGTAIYMVTCAP